MTEHVPGNCLRDFRPQRCRTNVVSHDGLRPERLASLHASVGEVVFTLLPHRARRHHALHHARSTKYLQANWIGEIHGRKHHAAQARHEAGAKLVNIVKLAHGLNNAPLELLETIR